MVGSKATHIGYVTPTAAFKYMVLGAGVDDTEEGEHRLGVVACFAEETTVIKIRVRVVGGIDQTDMLKGRSRFSHSSAVTIAHTCCAEGVSLGHYMPSVLYLRART